MEREKETEMHDSDSSPSEGSKKRTERSNSLNTSTELKAKRKSTDEAERREEASDNSRNYLGAALHGASDIPDEALQGLIDKFGKGIEELLHGGGVHRTRRDEKTKKLLSDITAIGDESRQLQGVIELCEYFNMSMEELLSGFPHQKFVPALVELLHYEHNPDMMLLATRALSYMVESIPRSGKSIIQNNALPIFCSRLLCIQYIDVAEQTLEILGKLSVKHGGAILSEGGLMAVLTYLDFFSMNVQRSSVVIAANLCKNIKDEQFEFVEPMLPVLSALLLRDDPKLVESAFLCFYGITNSLQANASHIAVVASQGIVSHCLQFLSGATLSGSVERPGIILNILQIICKQQPVLAKGMVEEGFAPILRNLLFGNQKGSQTLTPDGRSLYDILECVDKLFPSLPNEKAPISITRGTYLIPTASPAPDVPTDHTILVNENQTLFYGVVECLLGPIKDIFVTNVDPRTRSLCLSIIMKMIHFIHVDSFLLSLQHVGIATFVANLLSSNRLSFVGTGLRVASILLEKEKRCGSSSPETTSSFHLLFLREGVVHEIDKLASPAFLQSASTSEGASGVDELKKVIAEHARTIQLSFFSSSSSSLTQEMEALTEAVRCLNEAGTDEAAHLDTIAAMLADGVSYFEFSQSGAVHGLLEYLTSPTPVDSSLSCHWERFSLAMEGGSLLRAPLHALVMLLQDTLAQSDKLPLLLNDHKGKGSGIKFLGKSFKLRLALHNDASISDSASSLPSLEDFSSNTVGIEPLACISSIERFLWTKIQPSSDTESEKKTAHYTSDDELHIEDDFDDDSSQSASDSENLRDTMEMELPSPMVARKGSSNSNSESEKEQNKKSSGADSIPKLSFFYDGKLLCRKDSVLKVIQRECNARFPSSQEELSDATPASRMWKEEYTITYRRYNVQEDVSKEEKKIEPKLLVKESVMEYFMSSELHFQLPVPDTLREVLLLLHFLHAYITKWNCSVRKVKEARNGQNASGLSNELLANKLTQKLSQQLQDTLTLCSGEFPRWCNFFTSCCPYLLPLEVRRHYFICSSFGIARALHCLQSNSPSQQMDGSSAVPFTIGRIQRQKVRVARSKVLTSAFQVMGFVGSSRAVLEVEYFDEAGTGLGPTLEFFTLFSHQMQRKDLSMWAFTSTYSIPTEDASSSSPSPFLYVKHEAGLFPAPYRKKEGEDGELVAIKKLFRLFGWFMGRALLDERLLDIHLSTTFYKWVLGTPLSLDDLLHVRPAIASTLKELSEWSAEQKQGGKETSPLFKGAPLEELDLFFVLPTDSDWELKENGSTIPLCAENVDEYVSLVLQHYLVDGVKEQMLSFQEGLESVLPVHSLRMFTPYELDALVCGWEANDSQYWDTHAILDAIVCDHQYNANSLPVQYFVQSLHDFTAAEKRNFMFFLTGSPRLPIGGFKSLHPKLTVVRKETSGCPDDFLPSVMTCVNYVKLPAYSTLETTRSQLKKAITDGLGSFHLS